ncbi:hypothetical protein FPQ18DRAFT_386210 [Pyronema domesticum]|nr:hypothetical protein FPQ18DRAFT_386210 [Pyronema domesticum]
MPPRVCNKCLEDKYPGHVNVIDCGHVPNMEHNNENLDVTVARTASTDTGTDTSTNPLVGSSTDTSTDTVTITVNVASIESQPKLEPGDFNSLVKTSNKVADNTHLSLVQQVLAHNGKTIAAVKSQAQLAVHHDERIKALELCASLSDQAFKNQDSWITSLESHVLQHQETRHQQIQSLESQVLRNRENQYQRITSMEASVLKYQEDQYQRIRSLEAEMEELKKKDKSKGRFWRECFGWM